MFFFAARNDLEQTEGGEVAQGSTSYMYHSSMEIATVRLLLPKRRLAAGRQQALASGDRYPRAISLGMAYGMSQAEAISSLNN